MHEQWKDIKANIRNLDEHIINLGYSVHAIHTAPIIRRESFYINDLREQRRALFNALYHFARKLDIHYICPKIKPVDYKLSQVADLICTMELLKDKADRNDFSVSESEFFGTPKDFKKKYI